MIDKILRAMFALSPALPIILLSACDISKEANDPRKDPNAAMVVEIKKAAEQIGRCEQADLTPRILWGNEWLRVQCDFIKDNNAH